MQDLVELESVLLQLFSMDKGLWEPKKDEASDKAVRLFLVIKFDAELVNTQIFYLLFFLRVFQTKGSQVLSIRKGLSSLDRSLILGLARLFFFLRLLGLFELLLLVLLVESKLLFLCKLLGLLLFLLSLLLDRRRWSLLEIITQSIQDPGNELPRWEWLSHLDLHDLSFTQTNLRSVCDDVVWDVGVSFQQLGKSSLDQHLVVDDSPAVQLA